MRFAVSERSSADEFVGEIGNRVPIAILDSPRFLQSEGRERERRGEEGVLVQWGAQMALFDRKYLISQ